ncbi:MAG: aspartate 1-decarboxylase [Dehalococcoidia bacterium]|nr:aspartate 1-decarboxylase [Dehalococcoidia bacterium]
MRIMLKSKIHGARITEANVNYEGSITIDRDLMQMADILPYEQVHVLDVDNGSRLTTYAIEGPAGSGVFCVNGAAARLVEEGHKIIILTYQHVRDEESGYVRPRVIHMNEINAVVG